MTAYGVFQGMLGWNLLPLPLLVPAYLRLSPGLALVAFACFWEEAGSDPHCYSEKAYSQTCLSLVTQEVAKKVPKGEMQTAKALEACSERWNWVGEALKGRWCC